MSTAPLGLVLTGGTIGSDLADATARLGRIGPVEELVRRAAASSGVDVVVRAPFSVHSEEMWPGHWARLADTVRDLASEAAAVVVLHGTDTAAYTSAVLNYLLADVPVPVVVTGSALPPAAPDSDAPKNIAGAVRAAAAGLPPGTYLAFEDDAGDVSVYLGTRVRKAGSGRAPFESVGRHVVGVVANDAFRPVDIPSDEQPSVRYRPATDERVHVIGCHPGQRVVEIVEWAVANDYRGILLGLYPAGTGPTGGSSYSAEAAARVASEAGAVVAAALRRGSISSAVRYPSTDALADAGAVILPLPIEAASPKLMWALAQSDDPAAVRRILTTPIRGDLH